MVQRLTWTKAGVRLLTKSHLRTKCDRGQATCVVYAQIAGKLRFIICLLYSITKHMPLAVSPASGNYYYRTNHGMYMPA